MRDFGKISTRLWKSRSYKSLLKENDYESALVYVFLHTNEVCTSIGVVPMHHALIMAALNMDEATVERALIALSDRSLIHWHKDDELIVITNFLEFTPITNPKHAEGAMRIWRKIDLLSEKQYIAQQLMQFKGKLTDSHIKELSIALSKDLSIDLCIGYAHGDGDGDGEGDIKPTPKPPSLPDPPKPQPETHTEPRVVFENKTIPDPPPVLEPWSRLGRKLLGITGLDRSAKPQDTTIVRQWLADWTETQITEAVQQVVSGRNYEPPGSLKYFEPAIRRHAEKHQTERNELIERTVEQATAHTWHNLLEAWVNGGTDIGDGRTVDWPRSRYGPAPNEPGCRVPPDLLAEYETRHGSLEPGEPTKQATG